jgi:D-xylose reductase
MNEIPLIGLGTWKIPKEKTAEIVYHAIKELNIRHIDCACDYGNEKEVGEGIHQAMNEGIVKREDLWITSKLWNTYHSEEHVLLAMHKTLSDMNITYLDLYLVHFPIALKFVPFDIRYPPEWIHDPNAEKPCIELATNCPMYLTWKGMEDLVDRGLTRYIGVANFNIQLLLDMMQYAKIPPYLNQIELNPLNTQEQLVSFCSKYNIKITAYSSFASTGYTELGCDIKQYGLKQSLMEDPVIVEVANHHNKSPAQILLKWSIQRNISVIPKASNKEHLKQNCQINDFELTSDEVRTFTDDFLFFSFTVFLFISFLFD